MEVMETSSGQKGKDSNGSNSTVEGRDVELAACRTMMEDY